MLQRRGRADERIGEAVTRMREAGGCAADARRRIRRLDSRSLEQMVRPVRRAIAAFKPTTVRMKPTSTPWNHQRKGVGSHSRSSRRSGRRLRSRRAPSSRSSRATRSTTEPRGRPSRRTRRRAPPPRSAWRWSSSRVS